MSYERTEELPELQQQGRAREPDAQPPAAPSANRAPPEPKAAEQKTGEKETGEKETPERPPKQVAEEKRARRERLPGLEDDADVGVEKKQVVTRDGKADLAFTGMLVASAAPEHTIEDHWWEYRVYLTSGGKHVFSKVDRTLYEGEDDAWTAEVFDPSPSSVPSQLLRSARELARSKPVTWQEAAVAFYGYGPIAKALYRKLDGPFEEQIE